MGKRALYCLWELTYRCNARCGICPYWQHPSPPERELRLPDIKRGLDRLHAHGCRAVNFSGGEPTIRQDLEEIIGHAASLAMWTSMVTNGSRLTRDRMCRLRDAGLDNLLMSLDSLQPDVHDAHRGIDGLHAKVLERARWLAQDFLTGHRMGGFMFVLSSKNLREIEEVLAFADDLGVYVVIQPYHDKKTGDPQYNASIDQQFVDELLRLREERTNLLCSEGYLRGLARFAAGGQGPPCSAGRKYFSIDPYGFIGPCVDMPRAGHILSDDLDVVARADVMQHVHQCPGCWYAFRGESDASLSLRGCHDKVKLGLSVLARNVRRMRRAEDLQH
jgi:MoaA/NifB/PqqE/SkfB family radical SAM enzyme